ncbi:hypothetical protein [Flavobacterium sp. Arc2]|jgi:hypothetical protein|uniref:hypothetical protein n=1 Tax=Flavobacterium sp. Arc2 TaxID=3046685 RepID=UPI00352EFCC6
MNILYIIIGMNVTIIFLFDKSKLDNKQSFFKILGLNIVLFLIGLIILTAGLEKSTAVNSLFIPLIAQGFYYVLSKVFYLKYKRNSIDTYWTMDKTVFVDGWFNSLFWIVSILLFLLVL